MQNSNSIFRPIPSSRAAQTIEDKYEVDGDEAEGECIDELVKERCIEVIRKKLQKKYPEYKITNNESCDIYFFIVNWLHIIYICISTSSLRAKIQNEMVLCKDNNRILAIKGSDLKHGVPKKFNEETKQIFCSDIFDYVLDRYIPDLQYYKNDLDKIFVEALNNLRSTNSLNSHEIQKLLLFIFPYILKRSESIIRSALTFHLPKEDYDEIGGLLFGTEPKIQNAALLVWSMYAEKTYSVEQKGINSLTFN